MTTPKPLQNISHATRTAAVLGLFAAPATSFSQTTDGDAATIALLREQVAALTRRLEEVERRQAAQASAKSGTGPAVQTEVREAQAAAKQAQAAAAEAKAAQRKIQALRRPRHRPSSRRPVITAGTIEGLLPPEEMGSPSSGDDALRSDLPGLSLRIPNTNSEVRLYGFAKVTAWQDFNARNQSDAPAVQTIPLNGSGADEQGGDFGISARFSRIGIDTRTLTDWGTLETRIEGDFGGGTATNATFRLRQAWGELGTEAFRVLIGQANSLWNEGIFETLIDSTNLNQSFIRQAQIRLTGRLAPGLTGQFSVEAPDTTYTTVSGVVNPSSTIDGGASPAFNTMPDFLGRLTYRKNGLEIGGRALLRDLTVRTEGTAVSPSGSENALGWGVAGHVRFPMRWISDALGRMNCSRWPITATALAATLPATPPARTRFRISVCRRPRDSFSLDTVQTWGVDRRPIAGSGRRRCAATSPTPTPRQDYPDYAARFHPRLWLRHFAEPRDAAGLRQPDLEPVRQGERRSLQQRMARSRDRVPLFAPRTCSAAPRRLAPAGDGDATANRLLFGGVVRF